MNYFICFIVCLGFYFLKILVTKLDLYFGLRIYCNYISSYTDDHAHFAEGPTTQKLDSRFAKSYQRFKIWKDLKDWKDLSKVQKFVYCSIFSSRAVVTATVLLLRVIYSYYGTVLQLPALINLLPSFNLRIWH